MWPKMEKCVTDVKKQGSGVNAYAVCYDSLMGKGKGGGKKKAAKEVGNDFILDSTLAILYKEGEVGYCPECKKNMTGTKPGEKCPECKMKLVTMSKKELDMTDIELAVMESFGDKEMTADVNQIVTEVLVGDKAFQGHAGRPGKRGGSAPKGGAIVKTKVTNAAAGAVDFAAGIAGGYGGGAIGSALAGPIGAVIGGALGINYGVDASRKFRKIAKLGAAKLKTLLSKSKKKASTKAAEITDDEAADKLIEALIAVLENYNPEEAVKK
jgi:hypothetical protein